MSKLAFVFPGQGSQHVGMGKALWEAFPTARSIFEQADDVLGFAISQLCFEGPEDRLQQTANAQPAILTTSIACLAVLQEKAGVEPGVVAGHSLGEYSAIVAAGVTDFPTALKLVRLRGLVMQQAAETRPGAMAAMIGADDAVVEDACRVVREQGGIVCIANYNSPGQTVISGEAGAVQRAIDLARERGARRAIPLPVGGAFHSPLMAEAADQLAQALAKATLGAARVPVVANVSADGEVSVERIAAGLVQQLCAPVQWTRSVRYMAERGVSTYVEVGPGQVLSGLIKRIEREAQVLAVNDPETVRTVAQALRA